MQKGCIYLGDQAALHEDGTWNILGRRQDMISMKNGNKLYYQEMDEELSQIEAVREACVLYTDDRIIAVIVANQEDQEQIRSRIKVYNKKQSYYRKIEDIWFRQDAFPRTSMGKMIRKNMIEEYKEQRT